MTDNSDHRTTVHEEFLLCDEELFLSSPSHFPIAAQNWCIGALQPNPHALPYQEKQEREEFFLSYLVREKSYSPCFGYLNQLQVSKILRSARSKAVQYVINMCERLSLRASTAFNAANYLDRFLSMNSCMKWEAWMMELLSIACLSLSCKFDEVYIPSLDDLQMEDLEHQFKAGTIEEMEITVLKALDWRLSCVTSLSYVDLLLGSITESTGHIINRITHVLLHSLSDPMVLKFRASIIAISALRCVMQVHDAYKMIITFSHLIPPDEMADVDKCTEVMKVHLLAMDSERRKSSEEWSPVSVIGAQFYCK